MDNSLTADVAFTHVFEKSTSINIDRTFFDDTPLATSTSVVARVQSFVDTLAVNLRYTF